GGHRRAGRVAAGAGTVRRGGPGAVPGPLRRAGRAGRASGAGAGQPRRLRGTGPGPGRGWGPAGGHRRRRAPRACRRGQREKAMSDWLFDLGNTRFKAAPWDGGAPGEAQAWPHGEDLHRAPVPRGRRAWLASVAGPAMTAAVLERLHAAFDEVHLARTQAECAGVRVAYPNPERFGVDRFLALLA